MGLCSIVRMCGTHCVQRGGAWRGGAGAGPPVGCPPGACWCRLKPAAPPWRALGGLRRGTRPDACACLDLSSPSPAGLELGPELEPADGETRLLAVFANFLLEGRPAVAWRRYQWRGECAWSGPELPGAGEWRCGRGCCGGYVLPSRCGLQPPRLPPDSPINIPSRRPGSSPPLPSPSLQLPRIRRASSTSVF